MTNKVVLITSIIGVLVSLVSKNSVSIGICSKSDTVCRLSFDITEHFAYIFVPVLFFSFVTYFAPERIFASWWKFARVAIPVAFIANALLVYDMSKSTDAFDDIVYIPVLILIYGSFILGSAWQIWKGWSNK